MSSASWPHDRLLAYLQPYRLGERTLGAVASLRLTGHQFVTLDVATFCEHFGLVQGEAAALTRLQERLLRRRASPPNGLRSASPPRTLTGGMRSPTPPHSPIPITPSSGGRVTLPTCPIDLLVTHQNALRKSATRDIAQHLCLRDEDVTVVITPHECAARFSVTGRVDSLVVGYTIPMPHTSALVAAVRRRLQTPEPWGIPLASPSRDSTPQRSEVLTALQNQFETLGRQQAKVLKMMDSVSHQW